MRIGIFDSGLGGLLVTHAVTEALPMYDYVYLGDTARVPYGDRSEEVIHRFTRAAVDVLFRKFDCALIIVACNTASAEALRKIQQEYLPANFPDRRVLGVIIPAAESVTTTGPIGVLATRSTVRSGAFPREVKKVHPNLTVVQEAAPLLVPLIENDAMQWADPIIATYTAPLIAAGVTEVILGCTHYGCSREQIASHLPGVKIISQEDVVPEKLMDYLERHPEIRQLLSTNGSRRYLLTDILDHYQGLAQSLIGKELTFEAIDPPL